MKLFIASDVHGSEYFCKKMIDCYKSEKADKMILLGDLLYHGPRNDLPNGYNPKAVIALLNEVKNEILCIRGNCDTEVDQMVLDFPVLADYAAIFVDGCTIYATHGHKYNSDNLPPITNGDILLHGHTHIPAFEQNNSYTYINPGSVSIPKNGSHHGYVIWENKKLSWIDFEGNVLMSHYL